MLDLTAGDSRNIHYVRETGDNILKRILLISIIFLLFYDLALAADIEVGYAGALKNFMHKGDISSKFSLAELEGKSHLYALGAVENLKGEIQIFDGIPSITFSENGVIAIDNTFN